MEDKPQPVTCWTTAKEIAEITYMASDEIRPGKAHPPTIEERKQRLMAWRTTSYKRQWSKGFDVEKCREHAAELYGKLG